VYRAHDALEHLRDPIHTMSFDTNSAAGSRFVETILTVVETCHRQSRNSFKYLADAMHAHFAGQPAPSLLSGV